MSIKSSQVSGTFLFNICFPKSWPATLSSSLPWTWGPVGSSPSLVEMLKCCSASLWLWPLVIQRDVWPATPRLSMGHPGCPEDKPAWRMTQSCPPVWASKPDGKVVRGCILLRGKCPRTLAYWFFLFPVCYKILSKDGLAKHLVHGGPFIHPTLDPFLCSPFNSQNKQHSGWPSDLDFRDGKWKPAYRG